MNTNQSATRTNQHADEHAHAHVHAKCNNAKSTRTGRALLALSAMAMMQSANAFSLSSIQTQLRPTHGRSMLTTARTLRTTSAVATASNTHRRYITPLQLMETDDNNSDTDTSSSSSSKRKSILEPGMGPTIVIEPNTSSTDIYKQAVKRTSLWTLASILFGTSLYFGIDPKTSEEFFAGYLLEQSLSIDNVLVFLLLFDYFKVPLENQDRVLNYGIYGAVVMRAVMIGVGSVALNQVHAVLLVFAAILIYSSATVLLNLGGDDDEDEEEDMSENYIVQLSKKLFDASDEFDGDRFFTIIDGVKKATPLFICLVSVEISDVVFAVDSIPAVFGVTEVSLSVFVAVVAGAIVPYLDYS
jgi:TerC family integral membrane protein